MNERRSRSSPGPTPTRRVIHNPISRLHPHLDQPSESGAPCLKCSIRTRERLDPWIRPCLGACITVVNYGLVIVVHLKFRGDWDRHLGFFVCVEDNVQGHLSM